MNDKSRVCTEIMLSKFAVNKMLYLLSHIADKLLVCNNYTGTEKHKINEFQSEKIILILAF